MGNRIVVASLLVGIGACAPSAPPAPPETERRAPAGPPHALAPMPADCSADPAPSHPISANVAGDAFAPVVKLVSAGGISSGDEGGPAYDTYRLELDVSDDWEPPIEVDTTLLVPKGEGLDGKTFRKLPLDDVGAQPGPESGLPEIQGWSIENVPLGVDASHVFQIASLRVEFGKRRGNVLPGRIRLCAPDVENSQVAGAFEVTLPTE